MPDAQSPPQRILVVDDCAPVLDLLRLLLEHEGYAVATAATLRAALAALGDGRPDLVICDPRLPGVPSFALLDRLAANSSTARIPVIVCSGALRALEDAGERLRGPGSRVLLKPFDIDTLLTTVATLLNDGVGQATDGAERGCVD